METLTYKELKEKANKALNDELCNRFYAIHLDYEPFNFSMKDIYNWAILNGYTKKRMMIKGIRKIYYVKP